MPVPTYEAQDSGEVIMSNVLGRLWLRPQPPAAPKPLRPLTPAELRAVSGGDDGDTAPKAGWLLPQNAPPPPAKV